MRKLYISAILFLCYSFVNAQVPNAGFETWAGGFPTSWSGSASSTISQDASAHSGSFATKGIVVGTTTPYITTPTTAGSMFSISQPYNTLEFYYKFNSVGGDGIFVTVRVYNAAGTTVVGSYNALYTNVSTSTYTHASLPIYYTNPSAAAKAYVKFTIQYTAGGSVNAGSYFVVDDVLLSGIVGVNEMSETNKLQVFPNPVHDNLKIRTEADGNKPVQIKLTDVLGRVVLQRASTMPVNGYIEDALNVESYASGLYFLTLVSDKKSLLRRVVVE